MMYQSYSGYAATTRLPNGSASIEEAKSFVRAGPLRQIERAYLSILLATFLACSSNAESGDRSHGIAGEWIEIYPRSEARMELTLHDDSSASGTYTDPEVPSGAIGDAVTEWRIGSRLTPDGLCLRFGEYFSCQGYRLQGDTLFLADGVGTVLVRSNAVNGTVRYVPRSRLNPSAPGESGKM